ncbi:THAP-type domain-containing protein [Aphis craccivora]|uniref:THAP-type domain-containing protein n=1 Tax=Aphis craccivora TaxID=307492 RepID=A0A6G0Y7I9_APHCR|nr:THAP-type domain-containing protein [Aphis craccivora]
MHTQTLSQHRNGLSDRDSAPVRNSNCLDSIIYILCAYTLHFEKLTQCIFFLHKKNNTCISTLGEAAYRRSVCCHEWPVDTVNCFICGRTKNAKLKSENITFHRMHCSHNLAVDKIHKRSIICSLHFVPESFIVKNIENTTKTRYTNNTNI